MCEIDLVRVGGNILGEIKAKLTSVDQVDFDDGLTTCKGPFQTLCQTRSIDQIKFNFSTAVA